MEGIMFPWATSHQLGNSEFRSHWSYNNAQPGQPCSFGLPQAFPPRMLQSGAPLPPDTFVLQNELDIQAEQSVGAMTTSQPRNASEWQLYRVLQRANLLQYYDTFIAQGGDDVQQLCEAGEDEFLEIMALVGMASKPLHVRRLQKALQEWVSNPGTFQSSISGQSSLLGLSQPASSTTNLNTPLSTSTRSEQPTISAFPLYSTSNISIPSWSSHSQPQSSVSPGPINTPGSTVSSGSLHEDCKDNIIDKQKSTSPVPTPVLVESQINAIAEAAARLAKELPPFEAKPLNPKKPINREIINVMQLTDEDPNRMEQLRKFAAIYGRFDSKRKSEKPMTLHEISVNEASAQLCRHMVSLLTRREDLFPLARQVVRDSGYQYSKGHSRASETVLPSVKRANEAFNMTPFKRLRMDMGFMQMYMNLCEANPGMVKNAADSEKMSMLSQELNSVTHKQEEIKTQIQTAKEQNQTELVQTLQTELEQTTARQLQLYTEQSELIRRQRGLQLGPYEEDAGSDLPSGGSSPNNSADGETFQQDVRRQLYSGLNSATAKNVLFDEGLRIAKQFGMADFAEELKGLQEVAPEDEEEKDVIKQESNGETVEHEEEEESKEEGDNCESDSNVKTINMNGEQVVVKQEIQEVNGS